MGGMQSQNQAILLVLMVSVIFLVSVLLYADTIDDFFSSEDYMMLDYSQHFSFQDLASQTPGHAYRPLSHVFFKSMLSLFGWFNPDFFHLANVIVHAINSVLVFFLVLVLVKRKSIAFFSALAFAFFPLNYEGVVYITTAGELLARLALFASLIALWLFFEKKRNRLLALSVFFFALAVFTQEIALVFWVIIFSFEFSKAGVFGKDSTRKRLWFYVPFAAVTAVFSVLKTFANSSFSLSGTTPFLLQLSLFKDAFVQAFFPFSFVREFLLQTLTFASPLNSVFIALLCVLAALFFFFASLFFFRNRFLVFFFVAAVLNIAVFVFFGSLQSRYFYIASAFSMPFLVLFVSSIFESFFPVRRLLRYAVLALLVIALFFSSIPYISEQKANWEKGSLAVKEFMQIAEKKCSEGISRFYVSGLPDGIRGRFKWDVALISRNFLPFAVEHACQSTNVFGKIDDFTSEEISAFDPKNSIFLEFDMNKWHFSQYSALPVHN